MWGWIKELDRLIRGETTSLSALQRDAEIRIPVVGLSFVIILLGMFYGLCMGVFSIAGGGSNEWRQIPASMLKVPALFFLTLIVTFPSLYVFNALVGSRLTVGAMLRLLISALGVILTVLASLGTIVAFFAISKTSYQFMLLLNVVVYTLAGVLGLKFLLQTLHRLAIAQTPVAPPAAESPEVLGALQQLEGHVLGPHVRTIFRIWVIVFGLVGAQMAWVLRPFVGVPGKEFTWFRARESNFFEALWRMLTSFSSWQ